MCESVPYIDTLFNVLLKRIADVLKLVILKSYILGLLKKRFILSIKENVLFMKKLCHFREPFS